MNKEKIVREVEGVLKKYGHSYSIYEIDSLVDRWELSKANLRNILSKHPNWNDDAQAVVMTAKDERIFVNSQFRSVFRNFENYIKSNISADIYDDKYYNIMSFLRSSSVPKVTEDIKATLLECYKVKCNVGQKMSRVIAKIFKGTDVEALPEFNKHYAIIADALSPIEIRVKLLLSIHPCDYLEMSNGNSWKSCHNLNDGCYMSGTLSYMGDETSMILYTLDKNYDEDVYFTEDKINRQVFSYADNMLLQSRLYPNADRESNVGENKTTNFRNIVQSIFAECTGNPNLWTLEKQIENIRNYFENHTDSQHYSDYNYAEYKPVLSFFKDYENHGEKILIGSSCYCIDCGDLLGESGDTNNLYCYKCNHVFVTCEECGCEVEESQAEYIDGVPYCSSCVRRCDDCGQLHLRNELTRTYSGDDVCESCLSENFTYVVNRGEYYRNRYVVFVESENEHYHKDDVCYINSLEAYYPEEQCVKCYECNEYHLIEDSEKLDNEDYICNKCLKAYSSLEDCIAEYNNKNFKIGDLITGLKNSPFGYTSDQAIMMVVETSFSDICVRIIQQNEYPHTVGDIFWVEKKYFKRVVSDTNTNAAVGA